MIMSAIRWISRCLGLIRGFALPDERAAGLIVPSAPFVVEYIDVAAESARCSDVRSSATQKRVVTTERVCVGDERLKLHEHSLKLACSNGYVCG